MYTFVTETQSGTFNIQMVLLKRIMVPKKSLLPCLGSASNTLTRNIHTSFAHSIIVHRGPTRKVIISQNKLSGEPRIYLHLRLSLCPSCFIIILGGGETRLGNWEKWADELYTAMIYEHGVQCWNGPQRSTKVILRCGLRNSLVATSEPNRCEYQFNFETPALCRKLDSSDIDEGDQNSQDEHEHDEL